MAEKWDRRDKQRKKRKDHRKDNRGSIRLIDALAYKLHNTKKSR
jgi:hypothetical protein